MRESRLEIFRLTNQIVRYKFYQRFFADPIFLVRIPSRTFSHNARHVCNCPTADGAVVYYTNTFSTLGANNVRNSLTSYDCSSWSFNMICLNRVPGESFVRSTFAISLDDYIEGALLLANQLKLQLEYSHILCH